MVNYLPPIDQLSELNKELIPSLDDLEYPIVVVGGQALYYWVAYYHNSDVNIESVELIKSVDIDYAAKLRDARRLPDKWNIDDYKEAKYLPPPSLAVISLTYKDKIKEKNGHLFIDTDKYFYEEQLRANIVDIIDFPTGFSGKDFTDSKKLDLYTEYFEYPPEWQCEPSPKLRILNPISCLRSRLSNIAAGIKNVRIEEARIRAIRVPIYSFLEKKFKTNEFRAAKKYMKYFLEVIESKDGLKIDTHHNIPLLVIAEEMKDNILVNIDGIPEKYLTMDLQSSIDRISEKIKRKKPCQNNLSPKTVQSYTRSLLKTCF